VVFKTKNKMKKIIVIILWVILVSLDLNNTQNISVSSEGERVIQNDVLAKIIKSKVKSKHIFSEFCNKYSEIAVLCHLECGVPTSVQLAQAITESGGGKSELAKVANNLFGMKYYKEIFKGDYIVASDKTKWRKYKSFEDSFIDHADFLNKYYNHAVGKDWKYWANNCTGYGAMGYWKHIGEVIKQYKLWEYDELIKTYKR
jgi:flagellum-specific peptidoglycan hydrolase FlgJ